MQVADFAALPGVPVACLVPMAQYGAVKGVTASGFCFILTIPGSELHIIPCIMF